MHFAFSMIMFLAAAAFARGAWMNGELALGLAAALLALLGVMSSISCVKWAITGTWYTPHQALAGKIGLIVIAVALAAGTLLGFLLLFVSLFGQRQ